MVGLLLGGEFRVGALNRNGAASALSPLSLAGEGWGEGLFRERASGEMPSPDAQERVDLSRKRER